MTLKDYKSHESWALVTWHRITGSPRRLFGSALENHHSTVSLTISRGQRAFDLSQDWYYPDKEIIEIEMSATQFAEFLTSPNMGCGVPATIRTFQGKHMEDPPDEGVEAQRVQEDFKENTTELGKKLRETIVKIQKVLQKKTILKADREFLRGAYNKLLMEVEQNMPFALEQFREASDKVVQAGKAEVEAFTTHFIHALGLQKIEEMQKLLPAPQPKALPEPAEELTGFESFEDMQDREPVEGEGADEP